MRNKEEKQEETTKEIQKESLSKGDKLTYNILEFLSNFTGNLSRKLKSSTIELNFLKYKMLFGERDTDIYISTFPKSGTTLMQMMLYQMTSDGNMDFEHIYEKSPWIKNDAFIGFKPRYLPDPRLIKTHDNYEKFDPDTKGRFIYVLRDGMDVAVSLYHQDRDFKNPNLTFERHMELFLSKSKFNWFDHTRDWLQNKYGFNILYLKYEEIINDLEGIILKVSDFTNIHVDQSIIERTKERCSFDYMKQFEDKFGLLSVETPFRKQNFFRKGKSGDSKNYFTPEHIEAFNKRYRESGLNKFL